MPNVSIKIPQIGEGLREARIVAFLKEPGEMVKRDEPIYQMETDKAVMDVESPHSGKLVEWLAKVDDVVPIGDDVAVIEVSGPVEAVEPTHAAPVEAAKPAAAASSGGGARNESIPPRTRAYAKEKGLDEAVLAGITPGSGGKLMPADIDAYLASSGGSSGFVEREMPAKQRLLSSRLVRGAELVVPGTIATPVLWEPLELAKARQRESGDDFQPSSFTMFAYAVAVALREFPSFRSTITSAGMVRTYDHVHLGIAVGLPGDELVLAVVKEADRMDWREFATEARARIEEARGGKDQATEAVTVSLTNMQSIGLRDAVPVVVSPAVGTLFLGAVYNGLGEEIDNPPVRRFANLALTFDHRLINGIGAAQFLMTVKQKVETIASVLL